MAEGKYDYLAEQILENVGGKDNICSVAHCITRLRLKLKDVDKANTEVIEKLPGVIKAMNANGQYQVVLGNKVEDVYDQKRGASPFLQAWGQVAHRRQVIAICKWYNARMKFKSNVVATVGGAPLAVVRQYIENQKGV